MVRCIKRADATWQALSFLRAGLAAGAHLHPRQQGGDVSLAAAQLGSVN